MKVSIAQYFADGLLESLFDDFDTCNSKSNNNQVLTFCA